MVHVSSGNGTLDQEGFAAYNVSKSPAALAERRGPYDGSESRILK